MTLYIIEAGSNYYPTYGIEDWKKVFTNRDEAVVYGETLKTLRNGGSLVFDWVCMLSVGDDGFFGETVF